jgi:glycerol-3-phosphate dehydrogenase
VVRTISGVNLAPGRGGASRDGSVAFHHRRGKAPLITMFGGDVTTSRLRAEQAVSQLTPHYPMSPRWTASTPLPGGDFAFEKFDDQVEAARARWSFLDERQALRLVCAYGTRLADVLGNAASRQALGRAFGPELTEAEVRHLMSKEWARFPDDILWRRTKLGLTMPPEGREALAVFMAQGAKVEHGGEGKVAHPG